MAANGEHKMNGTPKVVSPYGPKDPDAEREERRKRRMKLYAFVAAFVVSQLITTVLIGSVLLKARTPKFQMRSATLENLQVSTLTSNASFNTPMIAELSIKNTIFGPYKYQNSTIEFFYQDYKLGEAVIPEGKVSFRSTKKFNVSVPLSSTNVVPGDVLGSELRQHAWIPLTSRATLKGKARPLFIKKKNKSTNLNCTMNLNISSRRLEALSCN